MSTVKEAYNRITAIFHRLRRSKSAPEASSSSQKSPQKDCIQETIQSCHQKRPKVVLRTSGLRSTTNQRPRSAFFRSIIQTTISTNTNSLKVRRRAFTKGDIRKIFPTIKQKKRAMTEIHLNNQRVMPIDVFAARLQDYNTYYQDSPEQLRQRQDKKGELVIDGLLNIYWGLKTSIRLQVDGKVNSPNSCVADDVNAQSRKIESVKVGTKRINKANDLSVQTQMEGYLGDNTVDNNEVSNTVRLRGRSVVMRKKITRASNRYRASINGHIYNQATSVFTPSHGSVTKVRVMSTNNAHDVIVKLFKKFRVENQASNFSLYVVKETQELREMPQDEYPLVTRVLVGPNEQLGKIFIMEKKMHKEISQEVAQYIKLDPNILRVFLSKFHEEEEREINRMKRRFDFYGKMIRKYLREAIQATKEER